ncbi:hypothetical protein [Aeromonas sp. sif0611]|uniref:hypothetical protein n=1 Tax=Aeromonas sp. sif0611 TaxID=2854787 RepID=UPI001C45C983|nr:hypothetical protein [Aeromonas sp. sif0611]MBV7469314.1 hypothetical protein [Aeromonas sp. sif0611]
MKEIALITLHGMGKVKPSYYSELEEMLKGRLKEKWTRVSFQNVQYAPILQEPEEKLWASMVETPENELDGTKLRQFFLFGFGDADSLEHSAHTDKKQYIAVQQEIQKALEHALLDFGGDAKRPVVIIAQSLGCQVISNYLWDAQHGNHIFSGTPADQSERTSFLALKSLTNLVTTGCNIPLFIAGLSDRKCFEKPNDSFVWDNFYDPDDVLGWPLKQLGPSYGIVRDHAVNSGGVLSSWNIASHGGYWSDTDVVSPLADILLSKMA